MPTWTHSYDSICVTEGSGGSEQPKHMGIPSLTVTGNIANGEPGSSLSEVAEDLDITSSNSGKLESSATTYKGGGKTTEVMMTSTDANIRGDLESLNEFLQTNPDAEHDNNTSSDMYRSKPTAKQRKQQDAQNISRSMCTKNKEHQGRYPVL